MRIVVLCALLTGCLGPRSFTPVSYYSIEPEAGSMPQADRTWAMPLGIQPFSAATRYRDRILYRLSEVEVGFYEYERWVEPPQEMVTRVVASTLHASGLFQQVRQIDRIQLPAWILSAALLRFDEVRAPDARMAECWLRLELRRAQDEQLLWSNTLKSSVALTTETPAALAIAMTRAVQQIARQLVSELQHLEPQS
jgi:ABC-type uncharacterized transport system auxiliary subunit